MRQPRTPKVFWPSWRYGPNGEAEIFQCESDVPYGWVAKPGQVFVPPELPPVYVQEELEEQLRAKGITPLGHWSHAYMKELIDQ
jgi:hypothetical protein